MTAGLPLSVARRVADGRIQVHVPGFRHMDGSIWMDEAAARELRDQLAVALCVPVPASADQPYDTKL